MFSVLVSSKGQIVLPAVMRRELGLAAGARLNVQAQPDGTIQLKPVQAVAVQDVRTLAGMVRAPSRGKARQLDRFDAATVAAAKRARSR